ncbi:MAG: dienelactone hydrolase family protein [Alistipes sp.]|nr:dienelactone hydrolase family protein [Alistipes sp.]
MKKILLTLIILGIGTMLPAYGQQSVQKYVIETEYLLYLPEGYHADTTARWPLVIFLHGAGETGTDIEKIKVHGLPKLVEQGIDFPFVGISPQATQYGWQPRTVKGLADEALANYRIDPNRLYLTGLSMGGFGTWATAMEYPGFFAAILPICAGGDTSKAHTLVNTPVWTFHGDADSVVPPERSDAMVEAARRYNPDIIYTVYPGVDHDSWTQTYENPRVWQWLLGQRKFRFQPVEHSKGQLEEYAGVYVLSDPDDDPSNPDNIVEIEAGSGILEFITGEHRQTLHPGGGDVFFVRPEMFDHLRFERDSDGGIVAVKYFNPGGIRTIKRVD